MYCSTCGAFLPDGRSACDTCGAPAPLPARRAETPLAAPAAEGHWVVGRPVGQCPRCGYRGEGLPYFSRGGHMAALVGATLLTAGAMGAGGLVYYVVRRDHRICPRCGRGWGREGERAVMPAGAVPRRADARLASGEAGWRGWSVLLFLLAAILVVGGFAAGEWGPFLLAAAAAGGGALVHRAADRAREARRAALIASLQLPVLKLAAARGGRLTVTEVAAELGWTLPRAEKVLQSLDDGVRVDSEVTDEGVIVYEFREILLSPPERRLEDPA